MAKDKLDSIINEMQKLGQIDLANIPSIDLYVDQVTTFIDGQLAAYRRNDDDKILTKTMINNYAKARLFPSPNKKKYDRDHIITLILIYHLKSQLSIADIKLLLDGISEQESSLDDIYNQFVAIQHEEQSRIVQTAGGLSYDATGDLTKTLLRLIVRADLEKRLAEKMIDQFYFDDK